MINYNRTYFAITKIKIFRINTTGSDVTMESKKLAAYYRKRMIPQSLLSDDKSNTNFSSSESLGLGKNMYLIQFLLYITK